MYMNKQPAHATVYFIREANANLEPSLIVFVCGIKHADVFEGGRPHIQNICWSDEVTLPRVKFLEATTTEAGTR